MHILYFYLMYEHSECNNLIILVSTNIVVTVKNNNRIDMAIRV